MKSYASLFFGMIMLAGCGHTSIWKSQNLRLLEKPSLEYPNEALTKGIQGIVTILLRVDSAGRVVDANPSLFDDSLLIAPAISAAKKFRTSPPRLIDTSKTVSESLTFVFSLTKNGTEVLGSVIIADTTDDCPGLKDPEVVQRVVPDYPTRAISTEEEGKVWVKVMVGKEGIPLACEVIKSDNQIFNQSALKAALQFRFQPALLNGKPIGCFVSIPFRFRLRG